MSPTVKITALLATPFTVTVTGPVIAYAGTATTMVLLLQVFGVAAMPLKVSVPAPWTAPKLRPLIVTTVPVGPEAGVSVFIVGAVMSSVAHFTAASNSAAPLALKLAAVVSVMNSATRREGASKPDMD